jgi:hypothetical protein
MQFSEQTNPGQFIDRVREIKNQIKEFQLQNYTGSIIISKAEILDNQEKPSKFFFQQEIKRAKKKKPLQKLLQSLLMPVQILATFWELLKNSIPNYTRTTVLIRT